jgi:hypothetical protein
MLTYVVGLTLIPRPSLLAQTHREDSAAVARLLTAYNEEVEQQPDSALAILRAVLGRNTASREDSQKVGQIALYQANRLFKRGNINYDVETLSWAIAYASLSDSAMPTPAAMFLLGASYFHRAQRWEAIALRTDRCSAWQAFRDDATRAQAYLSQPDTRWHFFTPPPRSLIEADSILSSRCAPLQPT